ncbi:MAG: hypothetical protein ACYCYK_06075 [Candidatus Dormibacteria bacterium]
MIASTEALLVLARGSLADESAHLAVRVALALPLGGSRVILALVDTASALALPEMDPGGRGHQLVREFEALTSDEDVPVLVERESLERLGLAGRTMRPGISLIDRDELEQLCRVVSGCLVL